MHSSKIQETGGRPPKKQAPIKPPTERKNTAIYITNLPTDASLEEVQRVFSRCGVIAEEIDGHKARIKMYVDDQGNFKGDALVVYFRGESVGLAVQMLDETQFRLVGICSSLNFLSRGVAGRKAMARRERFPLTGTANALKD